MGFGQVPLCSSRRIIAALERLGCYPGRAKGGSHVSDHRRQPSTERTLTAVVIIGRKEVPRGTLRNILMSLDISVDDFMVALR